ncbi:MAG: cupin domain-containing protein [Acidobacteria bacterium]|nr:cupin domain-containing protein [Acidobacteriota bacterium]
MKIHLILIVALSVALASLCLAQTGEEKKKTDPAVAQAQDAHSVIAPDAIKWQPFIPGAERATISGDPSKTGLFVIRIKMQAGLKVPPHLHPTDEHITVLSGKATIGMGERFDLAAGQEIIAGSYVLMPKRMPHFLQAKEETVVQVHGMGPFKVIWVNPADDLTKRAAAKSSN